MLYLPPEWAHDGTAEGEYTSMAIVSRGEYGVTPGIISSFPVRAKAGDWSIVEGIAQDDAARAKIAVSVRELEAEREAVKDLLG
jgi:malate dehydrogenase